MTFRYSFVKHKLSVVSMTFPEINSYEAFHRSAVKLRSLLLDCRLVDDFREHLRAVLFKCYLSLVDCEKFWWVGGGAKL